MSSCPPEPVAAPVSPPATIGILASKYNLQPKLAPPHVHTSGKITQFAISEQPTIVACKPWRQVLPNSNRRDDTGRLAAATASKLQILSENDINSNRPNFGVPTVPSGQKDNSSESVELRTVNAKQPANSSRVVNISGIKSSPRALPDPDYRAIKSWDIPSPDDQAIKSHGGPSLDHQAIMSWNNHSPTKDRPAEVSGIAQKSHKLQVKFALPPAQAPLQPKTALGTSPPLTPHSAPAPLRTKLTTQVPANIPEELVVTPNSKDIQATDSYLIPTMFDPFKYGRPSTTRADKSSSIDGGYSRPTYGSFPDAEMRTISKEPRSIVIKNLPQDPTFAMVSLVCKNTGKIETITLFESLRKARVIFVHSADAVKFINENTGGFSFEYQSGRQTVQHTVEVEMKFDTNFLSAPTHTLVTKQKATRVVQIVGWNREGLEYLVDSTEGENESFEALLVKLAGLYAYTSLEGRVEGVTWRKNEKGSLEANLIYSRIKDACCAIVAMDREVELSRCIITYGKDPSVSHFPASRNLFSC